MAMNALNNNQQEKLSIDRGADPKGNHVLFAGPSAWSEGREDVLLVRPNAVSPFVCAAGYDAKTGEWSSGTYFGGILEAYAYFDKNIKSDVFYLNDDMIAEFLEEQGIEITPERLSELKSRMDYDVLNKAMKAVITEVVQSECGDLIDSFASQDKARIGDSLNLSSSIAEWYVAKYPTDDLGPDIDSSLTFEEFAQALLAEKNVYDLIPGDSVIRERVFLQLSNMLNVDYDVIYESWLKSPEAIKQLDFAMKNEMDVDKPSLSDQIAAIRHGLEKGLTTEQAEYLAQHDENGIPFFFSDEIDMLTDFLKRGLDLSEVEFVTQSMHGGKGMYEPLYTYPDGRNYELWKAMLDTLANGASIEQLQSAIAFNEDTFVSTSPEQIRSRCARAEGRDGVRSSSPLSERAAGAREAADAMAAGNGKQAQQRDIGQR